MPKQSFILAASAFAALVPLVPLDVAAEEAPAALRLAMMDIMPMGGGMQQPAPTAGDSTLGMRATPGAHPAPAATAGGGAGGMRDDDAMRMGGGGRPAQGPGPMPMGQAQQQPMAMCPMMQMMQNTMRMGAAQQGMMPPMQGGAGAGMDMGMGGPMARGPQPMGSSAARLEGRIAYLRAELRITDAQAPAWETFAEALRSGREHLDAARAALQESGTGADPMARLQSYENHLRARTEAIHMTRMAFNTLYGQLDDAQKRVATTTMLPFIGAF